MKYLFLLSIFCSYSLFAQNTSTLIQQAEQMERQLKEVDASNLYQAVLLQDPRNVQALCKLAELQSILGEKATDKKAKQLYFESSYSFAMVSFLKEKKWPL